MNNPTEPLIPSTSKHPEHELGCPYEIGGDECHCTTIRNTREQVAQDIETWGRPLMDRRVAAFIARNGLNHD